MNLSDSFELVLLRYRDGYYQNLKNYPPEDLRTSEKRAIQDLLNAVMEMIKKESKTV